MGNTGSIPNDAMRRNGIIDAMSEYHRDKAAKYQNMHNQDKFQYHTGEKNMWNSWRT